MNSPLEAMYGMDSHCEKKRKNNILAGHCELQQWSHALTRLGLHPHEVLSQMPGGKLPLHIACSNGAPAVFVLALASSYPAGLDVADDDGMTPMHCACSCPDLALEALEALLRWSATKGKKEMMMQDSDGDTPLHSACRVPTSIEVLKRLLKANSEALKVRDKEHLTPLLRMWVRPSVLYGCDYLESLKSKEDFSTELWELWEKTLIFLRALADPEKPFRILHTIIENDCPRAVLKIALNLYPEELEVQDSSGLSPLEAAIMAPVFKVRELTDEGFCYVPDETDEKDETEEDPNMVRGLGCEMRLVPSVIETVLETFPEKKSPMLASLSYSGLHKALRVGKGWTDGVKSLTAADPEGVQQKDAETQMYSFMLAATFCKTKATHTETIFQLLRSSPEIVKLGIPEEGDGEEHYYTGQTESRKRKRVSNEDEQRSPKKMDASTTVDT